MGINLRRASGFTIVELLVVIVVIGILAAITIVSYTGISQKAKIATLQSDLSNASKQIKLFQATSPNNDYPTAIVCPVIGATEVCVKTSGSNTPYTYVYNNTTNPKTFTLDTTNGTLVYRITNNSAPVAVVIITCPSGFIVVPGSVTYGTSDFCVMKYEAKNVGGLAKSQTSGLPWSNIDQPTAASLSSAACSGCHLVTEAEWMTMAQNVLGVASNWSTGVVGSGYIYSGYDNNSALTLDASGNDGDGYYGTSTGSGPKRRTLTLSNGEVIWDMAGNISEFTKNNTTGVQQPGIIGGGAAWREWTGNTTHGSLLPDPFPSSTGISGASSWTSVNGIGYIYSSADTVTTGYYLRSGGWSYGGYGGVLSLGLTLPGGYTSALVGFRVSK